MPTSEVRTTPAARNKQSVLVTFYLLIFTALLLLWVEWPSFNLYWQQMRHEDSPLTTLGNQPLMSAGTGITEGLNRSLGYLQNPLQQFNERHIDSINRCCLTGTANTDIEGSSLARMQGNPHHFPAFPLIKPSDSEPGTDTVSPLLSTATPPAKSSWVAAEPLRLAPFQEMVWADVLRKPQTPTRFTLHPGDRVLFIGDSLMQGVAPHLKARLYKEYRLTSIDLSRQSTGLTYRGFFDWPRTLENTLIDNAGSIKLVVVFLGANDPWDMPDGKGQPFLRFQSKRWELAYRDRIRHILDISARYGAQVIWLQVPNMEKKQLNEGITYLNALYQSEVTRDDQLFLPTQSELGCIDQTFAKFTVIDGRREKIRTDDGIHFTPTGQRIIAAKLFSLLDVTTPNSHEVAPAANSAKSQ